MPDTPDEVDEGLSHTLPQTCMPHTLLEKKKVDIAVEEGAPVATQGYYTFKSKTSIEYQIAQVSRFFFDANFFLFQKFFFGGIIFFLLLT